MALKFLAVWPGAIPVPFRVPANSDISDVASAAIKALEGFLHRDIPGDSVSASLLSADDVNAISKRADAPVTRRDFRRVGSIPVELAAGGILVEQRSRESVLARCAARRLFADAWAHALAALTLSRSPPQAARRAQRRVVSGCSCCMSCAAVRCWLLAGLRGRR